MKMPSASRVSASMTMTMEANRMESPAGAAPGAGDRKNGSGLSSSASRTDAVGRVVSTTGLFHCPVW